MPYRPVEPIILPIHRHDKDDVELRQRLRELAAERCRYGSPRLTVLLRRDGFMDNHKRIERIYREEGLSAYLFDDLE